MDSKNQMVFFGMKCRVNVFMPFLIFSMIVGSADSSDSLSSNS